MSSRFRLHGCDHRGRHAYFLTLCTYKRRDTLRDAAIAAMVFRQILRAAARFEFALLAYCLMPDHVHLLLQGLSEQSDLRRFARKLKRATGQTYTDCMNVPLWQDGYDDHLVRPEQDLSAIARYIIEKPVRAQLTDSPQGYPFLGSAVWSIEEILTPGATGRARAEALDRRPPRGVDCAWR